MYLNTFKTVSHSLLPTTAKHASTCTIYRTDISNSVVAHTGYIATLRHKLKGFTIEILGFYHTEVLYFGLLSCDTM